MHPAFRSLWRKQWHESRRYLLGFGFWMILASLYIVAYETWHRFRAPVGHFSSITLGYGFFAAVALAMRCTRGEQTDGTYSFTETLPVSLRSVALTRLVGGAITLVLPILIAAGLLSVALAAGWIEQVQPREVHPLIPLEQRTSSSLSQAQVQLWGLAGIVSFGVLQLFLIISILGCSLRSGAQVGLLGTVCGLSWMILAGALWFDHRNPGAQWIYGIFFPQSLVVQWGYGSEKGHFVDHEVVPNHGTALLASTVVLLGLGWLFVRRYGCFSSRLSAAKTTTPTSRAPHAWPSLSNWIRGRRSALWWSELRQALPVTLCGLILALLMSVSSVLMESRSEGHSKPVAVLMDLPHSTWAVGTLWAIVVGSALFSTELSTKLGEFWRSRPIHPRSWFWCKFTVGWLAVILTLDGLTALICWSAPRTSPTTGMSWAYLACVPLMHSFLYALAVFGTCWLRKPVIGGLAALLGYTLLNVLFGLSARFQSWEPLEVYNRLLMAERNGLPNFRAGNYPEVYTALFLITIILAIAGYRLADRGSAPPPSIR